MDAAIVLIAHGSRRPEANHELLRLASQIQARRPDAHVVPAFLELASPTMDEAVEDCLAGGARHILLFPYFLSAGMHVTGDLEGFRRRLADEHPGVEFRLAPPLGAHPGLVEIVLDLLSTDPSDGQAFQSE